jgi:extracellular elastinolytic metalloproteinase
MYRSKRFVIAAAVVLVATAAHAQGRRPFDAPPSRIVRDSGSALTLPSNASPAAVLATYLRSQGRDEATSIVETSRATRNGVTNARFEQRAGNLPVYGTYAKAAINDRGELFHLVENLVSVRGGVAAARITAQQAIQAAVANLYGDQVPAFHSAPTATRVAVPQANGTLTTGYAVQTWTDETNQLDITVIDGDGSILGVESRTNNDSYNVFTESPTATPQAVVSGPGAGNAQSPSGWLAGDQTTTNIRGNNANAYLDVVSDNVADTPGAPVASGNFLTSAALNQDPTTNDNRAVAVQNLFFLNNVIHDKLYDHGFTEAAGNFQNSNFGQGGQENDSVNAEAQDGGGVDNANFSTPTDGQHPRMQMYLWSGRGTHEGGGVDNANFSTPTDGQHPRMQMYLWSGRGTHEVVVGGNTYLAAGAEFGAALTTTGIGGPLAVAVPADACTAVASLTGKVAVIDRGSCDFVVKVRNAQNAGAIAAIVVNNQGDTILVMGGSDRKVKIGAVFVGHTDGGAIKAAAGSTGTVRKAATDPRQIDGDVDSDIVFHEYCHGLTWRMIGGMSGPMAGALGEGMSDVCAILMNGDDVIGEYAFSDSKGIRREPYGAYTRTYKDMVDGEVHNDGELYGAIGWKLRSLFMTAYGSTGVDKLFDYLVDGMNFTPATPTYEQMRDGILDAVQAAGNNAAADTCKVWTAFAQYGVGDGAQATVRGKRVSIVESKLIPAGVCQ